MIWNRIAELVSEAPWRGVGANMTYYLTPPTTEAPSAWAEWAGYRIPHPHNVYLQIWYELGFIGAALFAALGALLVAQVRQLAPADRPPAYALLASLAIAILSSYSVWQIWLMCLFGFVVAMLALNRNAPQS